MGRGEELVCGSRGLLDDDPKPRYTPPTLSKRRYVSEHDRLSEEQRLSELNNLERTEATEDFGDSPFADRV